MHLRTPCQKPQALKVDRACYCPIVYNTLEAWKQETGFSKGTA
ncbi:MAG: hypothetical protein WHT08_10600 [Bryobacteraceae bacterium]